MAGDGSSYEAPVVRTVGTDSATERKTSCCVAAMCGGLPRL